jgi:PKHD-type hydroxylase
MRGEWCFFKSIFTPDECDLILREGMKIPSQRAVMGPDTPIKDESYRRSDIRFIRKTENPNLEFLFDKAWKLAIEANNDWFNFHITKLDYMQLAEYSSEEQGEYKTHQDVFWMNGDPFYHRKLTCIIQLTDPNEYEGGDFGLYDVTEAPNKEVIRERGTAIFIPSFVFHSASPVTKGKRHSLAIWFDGPKWR